MTNHVFIEEATETEWCESCQLSTVFVFLAFNSDGYMGPPDLRWCPNCHPEADDVR